MHGGERERNETRQAGMTLLHNICYCCMTGLITLRFTTPTTEHVWDYKHMRDTVLRGWSAVAPMGELGDGY